MRKKIMAVLLSCLTALTMITSAARYSLTVSAVSMTEMTSVAVKIITNNEGTYGSVNCNDHGAVSIGILQWHATRALQLMRSIANTDPDNAKSILGSTFYQEVISASSWNTRTFSASEGSAAAALLTSSAGVAAQDALAASDVQGYLVAGQGYGLSNASVLVYFAELYNRGSGVAARILSAANTSSYANITLSQLHQAALSDYSNSSGSYTTRLTSAYNTLISLGWGDASETSESSKSSASSEEETVEMIDKAEAISANSVVYEDTADVKTAEEAKVETVSAAPEDFSEDYAGDYVVDATSLNLRSVPDMDASILCTIEDGTTVAVTSGNGSWAMVTYGDETGYCAMEYLASAEDAEEMDETEADEEIVETEPAEENDTPEETTTEAAETKAVEETTAETMETTAEETTETTTEATTKVTEGTVQAYVEVEGVSDPEYATIYGDVNADGVVDTRDVVMLQRYLDGYVLLNERQLANADCQCDDVLDETDVTVIMQYLIRNLTAMPVL